MTGHISTVRIQSSWVVNILNLTFKKVRCVDVKDYMLISILVVKWNSVDDYLLAFQVQDKSGSVSDASTIGICADFKRERGVWLRNGDVVVNRQLEREVQREGVIVIKSKQWLFLSLLSLNMVLKSFTFLWKTTLMDICHATGLMFHFMLVRCCNLLLALNPKNGRELLLKGK